MGFSRDRLIAKLDEILVDLGASLDIPGGSQLQVSASLKLPGHDGAQSARSVTLETIEIDEVRAVRSTLESSTSSSADRHFGLLTPRSTSGVQHEWCLRPVTDSSTMRRQSHIRRESLHVPLLGLTPPESEVMPPNGRRKKRVHSLKERRKSKELKNDDVLAADKLIEGIWEQIHSPDTLSTGGELDQAMALILGESQGLQAHDCLAGHDFNHATKFCLQVTTASRTSRALEVVVQAHWIGCYRGRLEMIRREKPDLKTHEQGRIVLGEACKAFSWTEKELRNRMSIWKGYYELKEVAGWVALIFAGPGIYRFCKYRMGFGPSSLEKLAALKTRMEVAADTIQPRWRKLLRLVGETSEVQWTGHPHDWTVNGNKEPLALAVTYHKWDINFSFEHLQESLVDTEKWPGPDPRKLEEGPIFMCRSCGLSQSDLVEENECQCFPTLYKPNPRRAAPVQIFQTNNGKNNGLVACCTLPHGQAVGEFLGLITRDLADVDVMQSQAGDNDPYQIWQGKRGNFTRFLNHSCMPNCEFQTFSWLGLQRIVVVSKGVRAGEELTVDYSNHYWNNLDKICLCGEDQCRYKDRLQR